MSNFCSACGLKTYEARSGIAKCDGCDKAPFFCVCQEGRREQQRKRMEAARSRATADRRVWRKALALRDGPAIVSLLS